MPNSALATPRPSQGPDSQLPGSLILVLMANPSAVPAGFYTGWLLPAAAVGTLVFLVGCFMVFSDVPT